MTKNRIWWVRRGDAVKGPFPAGQISQYLVLGRVFPTDEVSLDKEEWRPVRSVPELIPDVLRAGPEDEMAKERLLAARRWADERRSHDSAEFDGSDRRHPSAGEHARLSEGLSDLPAGKRWSVRALQILAVFSIIGVVIYLGFFLPKTNVVSVAQCDAAPAPQVNWSHCRKSGIQVLEQDMNGALLNSTQLNGARLTGSNLAGADLSYADLSNASLAFVDFRRAVLTGANLRTSDLSQADLRNTDLSYADLSKATLTGTQLTGARLDYTVWIDGVTCLPGSVGECKR